MRVREKKYSDYGMTVDEAKQLSKRCTELNSDEEKLLYECASKANPALCKCIFSSLTLGLSFESLTQQMHIGYGKNDFYAYRKKTISLFRDALMTKGAYQLGIV